MAIHSYTLQKQTNKIKLYSLVYSTDNKKVSLLSTNLIDRKLRQQKRKKTESILSLVQRNLPNSLYKDISC